MKTSSATWGIAVVNWNGWADTIESLEAIFRIPDFCGTVVLVDNGSADDSLALIGSWAEGKVCAVPEYYHAAVRDLVVPPVRKPIQFQLVKTGTEGEAAMFRAQGSPALVVIASKINLGFSGGNNVALQYLLKLEHIQYFWLVNSDALPAKDSLYEMQSAISEFRDGPLMAGNLLVNYFDPTTIQSSGGRFNYLTCLTSHIDAGRPVSELSRLPIKQDVDYPVGAGLVVNRLYLDTYGLLSEDYFLYFEEIDWVIRSRLPIGAFCATRSCVYHKGGSATKNAGARSERSLTADYYLIRNRFLLARKVSRLAVVVAVGVGIVAVVRRTFGRKPGATRNAITAVWDGLLMKTGQRQ